MASQNYHDELFEEKSAEPDFKTFVPDPIEEDWYAKDDTVVAAGAINTDN